MIAPRDRCVDGARLHINAVAKDAADHWSPTKSALHIGGDVIFGQTLVHPLTLVAGHIESADEADAA